MGSIRLLVDPPVHCVPLILLCYSYYQDPPEKKLKQNSNLREIYTTLTRQNKHRGGGAFEILKGITV